MRQKILDLCYGILIQLKWKHIVGAVLVLFALSWAGMRYFEPRGADIASGGTFWWYFLVTAASAGYGGYVPSTMGGKIVGAVILFCGGAIFAAMFAKGISTIFDFLQRKKKGKVTFKMKDHTVILGYKPEETERLVEELKADPFGNRNMVLCSRNLHENPMPGKVDFVQGDNTLDDTLDRACVSTASRIIIFGHTDDRTLAVAIAATSKAKPDAHIVAHLERADNERHLLRLNPNIRCVTSMRVILLAQEARNPGSSWLLKNIASPTDPGTSYRLDIPEFVKPIPFWELMALFKEFYDAIVFAVGDSHDFNAKVVLNPPNDLLVGGGQSIFYIAFRRIDGEIEWNDLPPVKEIVTSA